MEIEAKKADVVFQEAQQTVREAVSKALQTIKTETGLSPSTVSITVEMVWTGPTYGDPSGEYFLGDVAVHFTVTQRSTSTSNPD